MEYSTFHTKLEDSRQKHKNILIEWTATSIIWHKMSKGTEEEFGKAEYFFT